MIKSIDLNSDLGEGFGPWSMGNDAAILRIVSSANIACGGHASDPQTMLRTLTLAKEHGVTVGAHPGYEDKSGFGRRVIPMEPSAIQNMVAAQIGALMGVAAQAGITVSYVKAHGALANLGARDPEVADAIAKATKCIDPALHLLAISGTCLEQAAMRIDLPVVSEIFADRGYLSNGQLVPRGATGDMITDPDTASDRIIKFLRNGLMPVVDGDPIPLNAQSICVHGDSPGALKMAEHLSRSLSGQGIEIKSFMGSIEA